MCRHCDRVMDALQSEELKKCMLCERALFSACRAAKAQADPSIGGRTAVLPAAEEAKCLPRTG